MAEITLSDFELVEIPQLEFLDDDKNLVTVPCFQITKYLITEELYYKVMCIGTARQPQHPKTSVTYQEAMNFAEKVNNKLGVEFEIPTANQYEILIREGNRHPITPERYLAKKRIIQEAKMDGHSRLYTYPVGELKPDDFGIHDLTWPCWQWSQTTAPDDDKVHIIKGMTWYDFNGHYTTCDNLSSHLSSTIVGFRLALKNDPFIQAQNTLAFLTS